MHYGPPNQNFEWAMAHPAHAAAPPMGQRVNFLGRRRISTSGFAYTATKTAVFALYVVLMVTLQVNIFR